MKILIIEDELSIANSLKRYLEEEDFQVDLATDGSLALSKIENENFDMILLDWQIPGKDGAQVCKELRIKKIEIPVIIITAYDNINYKVEAFEFGADDYITKPFNPREVVARIHSVQRRLNGSVNIIRMKYFNFDVVNHLLVKNNLSVKLTERESELLRFLCENKSVILSKEELCKKVWNLNRCPSTNLVEVTIKNLRKKFEEFTGQKIIKTVYGEGYIFLPY